MEPRRSPRLQNLRLSRKTTECIELVDYTDSKSTEEKIMMGEKLSEGTYILKLLT